MPQGLLAHPCPQFPEHEQWDEHLKQVGICTERHRRIATARGTAH